MCIEIQIDTIFIKINVIWKTYKIHTSIVGIDMTLELYCYELL